MAYSAIADITNVKTEQTLIEIAGTGAEGSRAVDTVLVNAEIANADGEIDGYLRPRYQVPLTGTPDIIIKNASIQLTVSRLYGRSLGMPENEEKETERIRKMLSDISKGIIELDVDTVTDADCDDVVISQIYSASKFEDLFDEDES